MITGERGMITDKINEIAKNMIGREINQRELRLIPYIQYVLVNEQEIRQDKINDEERNFLKKFEEEGFIKIHIDKIKVTKKFWDFMCEILFESYVKPEMGIFT